MNCCRISKRDSRIRAALRATHSLCARWIRETRASSIIELALLVPIFSAFVIGSAQFGLLCYTAIELSEAARAGVAYGSQTSTTASDTSGMQNAATNAAPNISGMSATASQFWVCSNAMTYHYTAAPTCTTGNHSIHYVQVNTSVAANPPFHLTEGPASFTLTGLAIMRVL
ncbi:MAG TPA: TadE/TadG family type IV pilus assembly protein [Acidobacteriaceae bacterium]|nr:TadE/TadG family type IV pilus assembly protein [Acidobacteriaceae bacterium]